MGFEGGVPRFPFQRPYSWCRGHCFPLLKKELCKEATGVWAKPGLWSCHGRGSQQGAEPASLHPKGCSVTPASFQTSLKQGVSVVKQRWRSSLLESAAIAFSGVMRVGHAAEPARDQHSADAAFITLLPYSELPFPTAAVGQSDLPRGVICGIRTSAGWESGSGWTVVFAP